MMSQSQGARDAGKKPAAKPQPAAKRRHDPAITAANRARRIAKDKALKERAKRKREQRMGASLNPIVAAEYAEFQRMAQSLPSFDDAWRNVLERATHNLGAQA